MQASHACREGEQGLALVANELRNVLWAGLLVLVLASMHGRHAVLELVHGRQIITAPLFEGCDSRKEIFTVDGDTGGLGSLAGLPGHVLVDKQLGDSRILDLVFIVAREGLDLDLGRLLVLLQELGLFQAGIGALRDVVNELAIVRELLRLNLLAQVDLVVDKLVYIVELVLGVLSQLIVARAPLDFFRFGDLGLYDRLLCRCGGGLTTAIRKIE